MNQKAFRRKALLKLATPEELDKMIRVTDLKGWIALTGLLSLIVVALLWAIFGTIPTVIKERGILIRPNGLQVVTTQANGQVTSLSVKVGDEVKQGQVIGKIRNEQGAETDLVSTGSGTVTDISAPANSLVAAQGPILTIENQVNPLKGVIYAPLAEGKKLTPGMQVQISPAISQGEQNGFLLGTIASVSSYPVTAESAFAELQNQELVSALFTGPVLRVEINLQEDPDSFSKYKWSTPKGPRTTLTNGTLFNANLLLGEQHPINIVLPIFNQQ